MKKKILKIMFCPECHGIFSVKNEVIKHKEIIEGTLECMSCHAEFPVIRYVPRLIKGYNYSDSWGELWKETGHLLRDSYTGMTFYHDTLFGKYSEENIQKKGLSPFGFDWPRSLKSEKILEIGPGTGVCTEHLVKTGAELVCIDMSDAIDTFPENLLTQPNINVIQADINNNIIQENYFDRIWLFQVLQHTPYPGETLKVLKKFIKKGGELAFTSYGGEIFKSWYYGITKRINDKFSWKYISLLSPILVPLKYRLMKLNISLIFKAAKLLLAPFDPRNIYYQTLEGKMDQWPSGIIWNKTHDYKLLMQYVIINTFDRITPKYTNSATHATIEKWSKEAGYSKIKIWGKGGVRARVYK